MYLQKQCLEISLKFSPYHTTKLIIRMSEQYFHLFKLVVHVHTCGFKKCVLTLHLYLPFSLTLFFDCVPFCSFCLKISAFQTAYCVCKQDTSTRRMKSPFQTCISIQKMCTNVFIYLLLCM